MKEYRGKNEASMGELIALLKLAEKGACAGAQRINSYDLGAWMGVSQQTASRWLVNLEAEHMIKRTEMGHQYRNYVRITEEGITALNRLGLDILAAIGKGMI